MLEGGRRDRRGSKMKHAHQKKILDPALLYLAIYGIQRVVLNNPIVTRVEISLHGSPTKIVNPPRPDSN